MHTVPPATTLHERPSPFNAVRLYLRQSLGKKVQAESIATQRSDLQLLAQQLGVTPEQWAQRHEYPDIDRAGDDFSGREQLTRLLQEARPSDLVLAWKQNRLGRDAIDASTTVRSLVKFNGVRLHTCEKGSEPYRMETSWHTREVFERGMQAQGEVETIRDNVRKGLHRRAREGFAANKPPFGYVTVLVNPHVKERKHSLKRIEIDPVTAPTVRRIFQMAEEGDGNVAICKKLNAAFDAPSPRGKGWAPSQVNDLLSNRRYMGGEWTYGVTRAVGRKGTKHLRVVVPENEVIRVARPDLAIVTAEQWNRVKRARAERNCSPERKSTAERATHPLSGILLCEGCGGPLRVRTCDSSRSRWRRRYYICRNHVRTGRCESSKYLPADEVEGALAGYVRTEVLPKVVDAARTRIREEIAALAVSTDARAAEAVRLRASIEELRRERVRLVRLAAGTDGQVDEVTAALAANQERARTLQGSLENAERPVIDSDRAAQYEADAVAHLERMRFRLEAGDLREVFSVLFPSGLRFKVGSGLWLIEGMASVPDSRSTSGCRLPATRPTSARERRRSRARSRERAQICRASQDDCGDYCEEASDGSAGDAGTTKRWVEQQCRHGERVQHVAGQPAITCWRGSC